MLFLWQLYTLKAGGCLGDTTKLGPLARTDLCAQVKGLLDKLMTHLGLGSSKEGPWGSLLGGRGAFLGASTTCLRSSTIPLGSLGALGLAEHLTACLSSEEDPWGSLFGGASAACLRSSSIPLRSLEALSLAECLTACLSWRVITCLGRTLP